jgi:hypothetical protein
LKYYYYPETVFKNIADAIREKRKILDKIQMEEAPSQIRKITGGADDGIVFHADILEVIGGSLE